MLDNFFQFGPIPSDALQGQWSYSLILLSYIIAVLASYVALDIAGRLRVETKRKQIILWIIGGAIAMGTGIWSMHFIGMLAFTLPIPMYYATVLTIVSWVIAIVASGFALFLFRSRKNIIFLILGGIILGLGIVSMHYVGMAAMLVHVCIRYIIWLFILSILIAIFASEVALWLVTQSNQGSFKHQLRIKILSALVMGAAICGMHYTGMAAAVFTPGTCLTNPIGTINPQGLAYYIAAATILIIGLALFVSTSRQLMSNVHEKEKKFLGSLFYGLADGIFACDANGNITLMNSVARKFHGIPAHVKIKNDWEEYFHYYYPDGKTRLLPDEMPLIRTLKEDILINFEVIVVPKQGKIRNLIIDGRAIFTNNAKSGAVIAIHDITERKQMEQQLMERATHDSLTQLPNRTVLYDRIKQAIIYAKRSGSMVIVLFIDLDRFKIINDSLGHAIGDELLKKVAVRINDCLRESDTVARIGGDEFVAILPAQKASEDAVLIAQKILKKILEPLILDNHELIIRCSIGISSYPKDGADPETLIKKADTAMYRVKKDGGDSFKFYTEEINTFALERLTLEKQLRQAIDNKEFILYYQPLISLKTGKIAGVEALIRWQHPSLGLLLPKDFIHLAEETGLIAPIGEWVLRTACAQCKTWHNMNLPLIKMAVNLSAVQFKHSHLAELTEEVLTKTKLEGKYLELELTETSIVENADDIINILKRIKELGVHIVVDDFGTGYSTLNYLKRLPIDKLKIDRSFIKDIDSSSEDAAIVLAVIAMAKSMKLNVVAEGMESKSQLDFLILHHCDEIQGYYFSRPITAEECTELLKKDINFLENN